MDELCWDVYRHILSLLCFESFQTVLVLRSVCHEWKYIIDDILRACFVSNPHQNNYQYSYKLFGRNFFQNESTECARFKWNLLTNETTLTIRVEKDVLWFTNHIARLYLLPQKKHQKLFLYPNHETTKQNLINCINNIFHPFHENCVKFGIQYESFLYIHYFKVWFPRFKKLLAVEFESLNETPNPIVNYPLTFASIVSSWNIFGSLLNHMQIVPFNPDVTSPTLYNEIYFEIIQYSVSVCDSLQNFLTLRLVCQDWKHLVDVLLRRSLDNSTCVFRIDGRNYFDHSTQTDVAEFDWCPRSNSTSLVKFTDCDLYHLPKRMPLKISFFDGRKFNEIVNVELSWKTLCSTIDKIFHHHDETQRMFKYVANRFKKKHYPIHRKDPIWWRPWRPNVFPDLYHYQSMIPVPSVVSMQFHTVQYIFSPVSTHHPKLLKDPFSRKLRNYFKQIIPFVSTEEFLRKFNKIQ